MLVIAVVELFTETFLVNIWLVLLMFCFILLVSKAMGYAISDEGIGTVRNSNVGWIYIAYVKWEDVIELKYGYSKLSLGKRLVIYSSKYTCKKKKFIAIDDSQRDFKEIVRIVCEKTSLPLT